MDTLFQQGTAMIPTFMTSYEPAQRDVEHLDKTLSNWLVTYDMLKLEEEKLTTKRFEILVGKLLYRELQERKRTHMVLKLKGKLNTLVRAREEKELIVATSFEE